MDDSIRLFTLTAHNKKEFVDALISEMNNIFGSLWPENYGRETPWSLLNLIDSDEIDSYQIIYVNDVFWCGSGGIVRDFNGRRVYQAGFRMFSRTRSVDSGIGSKSYAHEYNTKHQINRAITTGCSEVILSFNEYNKRLFDITHKYHLKKIFGPDAFHPATCPVPFNGVNQWLLTMSLR